MMRILVFISLSAALFAQPNLSGLVDELQQAVNEADWKRAAELSSALKQGVQMARDRSVERGNSQLVDSILDWLPADTETLVVAQRPFKIMESDPRLPPDALTISQGYILGMLAAAENGTLLEASVGKTVRLAALAARNFMNHPADARGGLPLGLIAYEGCAVYAFSEPVPESFFTRPWDDSIMGHRVWVSKGTQSDLADSETYLLTLVNSDTLLACNQREFLTEALLRSAQPRVPRAFPTGSEEWKLIGRSAPVWGVRRFHAARRETDPTLFDIDPEAIAVSLEVLSSNQVTARMLARSNPWSSLTEIPELADSVRARAVREGVWEVTISSKPEAEAYALLALMGTLGFVVLL